MYAADRAKFCYQETLESVFAFTLNSADPHAIFAQNCIKPQIDENRNAKKARVRVFENCRLEFDCACDALVYMSLANCYN